MLPAIAGLQNCSATAHGVDYLITDKLDRIQRVTLWHGILPVPLCTAQASCNSKSRSSKDYPHDSSDKSNLMSLQQHELLHTRETAGIESVAPTKSVEISATAEVFLYSHSCRNASGRSTPRLPNRRP